MTKLKAAQGTLMQTTSPAKNDIKTSADFVGAACNSIDHEPAKVEQTSTSSKTSAQSSTKNELALKRKQVPLGDSRWWRSCWNGNQLDGELLFETIKAQQERRLAQQLRSEPKAQEPASEPPIYASPRPREARKQPPAAKTTELADDPLSDPLYASILGTSRRPDRPKRAEVSAGEPSGEELEARSASAMHLRNLVRHCIEVQQATRRSSQLISGSQVSASEASSQAKMELDGRDCVRRHEGTKNEKINEKEFVHNKELKGEHESVGITESQGQMNLLQLSDRQARKSVAGRKACATPSSKSDRPSDERRAQTPDNKLQGSTMIEADATNESRNRNKISRASESDSEFILAATSNEDIGSNRKTAIDEAFGFESDDKICSSNGSSTIMSEFKVRASSSMNKINTETEAKDDEATRLNEATENENEKPKEEEGSFDKTKLNSLKLIEATKRNDLVNFFTLYKGQTWRNKQMENQTPQQDVQLFESQDGQESKIDLELESAKPACDSKEECAREIRFIRHQQKEASRFKASLHYLSPVQSSESATQGSAMSWLKGPTRNKRQTSRSKDTCCFKCKLPIEAGSSCVLIEDLQLKAQKSEPDHGAKPSLRPQMSNSSAAAAASSCEDEGMGTGSSSSGSHCDDRETPPSPSEAMELERRPLLPELNDDWPDSCSTNCHQRRTNKSHRMNSNSCDNIVQRLSFKNSDEQNEPAKLSANHLDRANSTLCHSTGNMTSSGQKAPTGSQSFLKLTSKQRNRKSRTLSLSSGKVDVDSNKKDSKQDAGVELMFHVDCFCCATCNELLVDLRALIYVNEFSSTTGDISDQVGQQDQQSDSVGKNKLKAEKPNPEYVNLPEDERHESKHQEQCRAKNSDPNVKQNDENCLANKQLNLYCHRHFVELFKPRCQQCDCLILDEECTEAEGKVWHIKHFCCVECRVPLGGQQYIIVDQSVTGSAPQIKQARPSTNDACRNKQNPYCLSCFDKTFGEKCEACGELITCDLGAINLENRCWHATGVCFKCKRCQKSLVGFPFLPGVDGHIYCSIQCSQLATIGNQHQGVSVERRSLSVASYSDPRAPHGALQHQLTLAVESSGSSLGSSQRSPAIDRAVIEYLLANARDNDTSRQLLSYLHKQLTGRCSAADRPLIDSMGQTLAKIEAERRKMNKVEELTVGKQDKNDDQQIKSLRRQQLNPFLIDCLGADHHQQQQHQTQEKLQQIQKQQEPLKLTSMMMMMDGVRSQHIHSDCSSKLATKELAQSETNGPLIGPTNRSPLKVEPMFIKQRAPSPIKANSSIEARSKQEQLSRPQEWNQIQARISTEVCGGGPTRVVSDTEAPRNQQRTLIGGEQHSSLVQTNGQLASQLARQRQVTKDGLATNGLVAKQRLFNGDPHQMLKSQCSPAASLVSNEGTISDHSGSSSGVSTAPPVSSTSSSLKSHSPLSSTSSHSSIGSHSQNPLNASGIHPTGASTTMQRPASQPPQQAAALESSTPTTVGAGQGIVAMGAEQRSSQRHISSVAATLERRRRVRPITELSVVDLLSVADDRMLANQLEGPRQQDAFDQLISHFERSHGVAGQAPRQATSNRSSQQESFFYELAQRLPRQHGGSLASARVPTTNNEPASDEPVARVITDHYSTVNKAAKTQTSATGSVKHTEVSSASEGLSRDKRDNFFAITSPLLGCRADEPHSAGLTRPTSSLSVLTSNADGSGDQRAVNEVQSNSLIRPLHNSYSSSSLHRPASRGLDPAGLLVPSSSSASQLRMQKPAKSVTFDPAVRDPPARAPLKSALKYSAEWQSRQLTQANAFDTAGCSGTLPASLASQLKAGVAYNAFYDENGRRVRLSSLLNQQQFEQQDLTQELDERDSSKSSRSLLSGALSRLNIGESISSRGGRREERKLRRQQEPHLEAGSSLGVVQTSQPVADPVNRQLFGASQPQSLESERRTRRESRRRHSHRRASSPERSRHSSKRLPASSQRRCHGCRSRRCNVRDCYNSDDSCSTCSSYSSSDTESCSSSSAASNSDSPASSAEDSDSSLSGPSDSYDSYDSYDSETEVETRRYSRRQKARGRQPSTGNESCSSYDSYDSSSDGDSSPCGSRTTCSQRSESPARGRRFKSRRRQRSSGSGSRRSQREQPRHIASSSGSRRSSNRSSQPRDTRRGGHSSSSRDHRRRRSSSSGSSRRSQSRSQRRGSRGSSSRRRLPRQQQPLTTQEPVFVPGPSDRNQCISPINGIVQQHQMMVAKPPSTVSTDSKSLTANSNNENCRLM